MTFCAITWLANSAAKTDTRDEFRRIFTEVFTEIQGSGDGPAVIATAFSEWNEEKDTISLVAEKIEDDGENIETLVMKLSSVDDRTGVDTLFHHSAASPAPDGSSYNNDDFGFGLLK